MISNDLWYKNAIFYEVSVKSYCDGNNDGIGDFIGLINKLDYLKNLGINCLWLLPFYPSPLKDDGYDISDYCNIHPDIGTLQDFDNFMREAHQKGIKVIADLAINHTSDQHPWFIDAKRSRTSKKRNHYVWSDTDKKYDNVRIIFLDTEKSNWTYDKKTSQYYWHRFYSHQPDLNFDNKLVQEEMIQIMEFWLNKGLDGFRVDAVPYLYEREGTSCENLPETHRYLKRLRTHIDNKYGKNEKILLAEANMIPAELHPYFGNGSNEFHMAFHFPLMTHIFLALAKETPEILYPILGDLGKIPDLCQWAIFLRNHDELTLEKVSEEIRQFMWDYYAPNTGMRSNLGIRRRLASLLDNDIRKLKMINSLLFSLPGTPVLYYGDEIGMGDNILLEDRNGVRTPMQWHDGFNAGFSEAPADTLIFPIIDDPKFGYQKINVQNQIQEENSIYNFIRNLIEQRKQYPFLGYGDFRIIKASNPYILAYIRSTNKKSLLILHNFTCKYHTCNIDLSEYNFSSLVDVFGQLEISNNMAKVTLIISPYQYLWLNFQ